MVNFFNLFLDFIYTSACEVCQAPLDPPEKIICSKCWGKLEPWREDVPVRFYALEQTGMTPSFSKVMVACHFSPLCRDVIHRMKYDGRRSLARKMGAYAAERIAADPDLKRTDVIVPVPLHPVKQRERGYNQCDGIGEELSRTMNVPFERKWVVRKRYTESQTGFNFLDRRKNVEGLFVVPKPDRVRDKTVLVVDDVITSGSTLDACGRSLLEAGAREVFAVALTHPVSREDFEGM